MSEVVSNEGRRVRVPDGFPRERLVAGELHLVRSRLDGVLVELALLAGDDDGWAAVEEAGRLARRALVAAVAAVPPLPVVTPRQGSLSSAGCV